MPTGDMVGDYATKALQGALFKKFRDQVMGVVPIRDPGPGKANPLSANIQTHEEPTKNSKRGRARAATLKSTWKGRGGPPILWLTPRERK